MGKAAKFHEMKTNELLAELKELKDKHFKLRFQHATGQLTNPMELAACKKDIARAKTILKTRELLALEKGEVVRKIGTPKEVKAVKFIKVKKPKVKVEYRVPAAEKVEAIVVPELKIKQVIEVEPVKKERTPKEASSTAVKVPMKPEHAKAAQIMEKRKEAVRAAEAERKTAAKVKQSKVDKEEGKNE